MLPTLSRGLRIALVLTTSLGYVAWHGHQHAAFAKGHGGGGGGGDDGGDDDDSDESSGGEQGGGGNDCEGDDCDNEGDDENQDKDQPLVTAGGLYTLQTYPIRETQRPLTMTQKVLQMRLGIGTDISAKGAFDTGGVNLEAIYGYADNFSLIGGVTDAYNFRQFSAYVGFEGAIAYDLFDIRVAANVHRSAYAEYQNFCQPISSTDPVNPMDPATCGNAPNAALVNLPDGNYHEGDIKFSLDLGFPFRYAFKPEIALVALQTLISIDFNSAAKDHVIPQTYTPVDPTGQPIMDSMGNPLVLTKYVPVGNGAKPDLNPSIGFAFNPIPQLSATVFAQLRVPDFDTQAGAFQVPVTLRLEATPNPQLDIGLEFTLLNIAPPDPQSPIDNRYVSAYMQARFGR